MHTQKRTWVRTLGAQRAGSETPQTCTSRKPSRACSCAASPCSTGTSRIPCASRQRRTTCSVRQTRSCLPGSTWRSRGARPSGAAQSRSRPRSPARGTSSPPARRRSTAVVHTNKDHISYKTTALRARRRTSSSLYTQPVGFDGLFKIMIRGASACGEQVVRRYAATDLELRTRAYQGPLRSGLRALPAAAPTDLQRSFAARSCSCRAPKRICTWQHGRTLIVLHLGDDPLATTTRVRTCRRCSLVARSWCSSGLAAAGRRSTLSAARRAAPSCQDRPERRRACTSCEASSSPTLRCRHGAQGARRRGDTRAGASELCGRRQASRGVSAHSALSTLQYLSTAARCAPQLVDDTLRDRERRLSESQLVDRLALHDHLVAELIQRTPSRRAQHAHFAVDGFVRTFAAAGKQASRQQQQRQHFSPSSDV